jgi:hypothetical protein
MLELLFETTHVPICLVLLPKAVVIENTSVAPSRIDALKTHGTLGTPPAEL